MNTNSFEIRPFKSAEVIKFLWSLNLKSRDCFLLINEFIEPAPNDYTMPVHANFVGSLSPTGNEFFEKYIHMKPQFI